jgi:hypothetical protein
MLVMSGMSQFSWVATDFAGNAVQPRIFSGGQAVGDNNQPIPNGSNPKSPALITVPTRTITTLSVDALPSDPPDDWWWQTFLLPQQDYVIWIYGIEIQGYNMHWNGNWDDFMMDMPAPPYAPAPSWPASFQRSDAIFQSGQSGIRVISQRWQNSPWERYPHLV